MERLHSNVFLETEEEDAEVDAAQIRMSSIWQFAILVVSLISITFLATRMSTSKMKVVKVTAVSLIEDYDDDLFDCEEERHWQDAWNDYKKSWCCSQKQKGCPPGALRAVSASSNFHCDGDESDWQESWSDQKKRWCCAKEQKACPEERATDQSSRAESLRHKTLALGGPNRAAGADPSDAASLRHAVFASTWANPAAETDLAGELGVFCWALMLPQGPEIELISKQESEGIGLFQCDNWAVYSNISHQFRHFATSIVHESLYAPMGGRWHTALNTHVFLQAWKQVVADGKWRDHAWTVKLDPDTVFVPKVFKRIVSQSSVVSAEKNHADGIFLWNCKDTGELHGPVEALSRRAVENWGKNHEECATLWTLPRQEDVYMQSCLEALNARGYYDAHLLTEKACRGTDYLSCTPGYAAYHPQKIASKHVACSRKASAF